MGGPAWLGIGAQRSGTTWFTKLLLQHPQLTLSRTPKKELHELQRREFDVEGYRRLFEDQPGLPGEWTPAYMRELNAPPAAAAALDGDAPVLVLLRDPVDRYVSAMKHYRTRPLLRPLNREVTRVLRADAMWGGMYATQLEEWGRWLDPTRIAVMQYEAVRKDPQAHADRVWDRLGLEPVPLVGVEAATHTTSRREWTFPDGAEEALVRAYEPEVARLERWGVDPSLWPHFG